MLSRTIRHSVLDTRWVQQLPPTFLLPLRAHLTTISHTTEPSPPPEALINPTVRTPRDRTSMPRASPASRSARTSPSPQMPKLPTPTSQAPSTPTTPLSDSVKSLLPLLKSQSPHYITAHIHGRPYLLTAGDTLRLPFLMPGVSPGDVLRLNRATTLGSRDYTLKAAAPIPGTPERPMRPSYLDERLFVCRAVVLGVEAEPMRVKEKTKRRQRRVKTVRSKHKYTVLKVRQVEVRGLEEVEAMGRGKGEVGGESEGVGDAVEL